MRISDWSSDVCSSDLDVDADPNLRAIVLCSQGKTFCAGADFSKRDLNATATVGTGKHLYKAATRLFRSKKPVIAAVHGAAIGGGLGLAVMAAFRVTCREARFSATFSRLGLQPGHRKRYGVEKSVSVYVTVV